MAECCGECRFRFDTSNIDDGRHGECRRYPPPLMGRTAFPAVAADDWCIAFQPAAKPVTLTERTPAEKLAYISGAAQACEQIERAIRNSTEFLESEAESAALTAIENIRLALKIVAPLG